MKLVVLIFAFTIVLVKAKQVPYPDESNCPANQEYDVCHSACPTTCENMNDPDRVCTLNCVIGCRCKEGYVLSGENCIEPKDCPKQEKPQIRPRAAIWPYEIECSANEIFNYCGTSCPRTCEHVKKGIKIVPCNKRCFAVCQCKDGYVRDGGKCVPESECSKVSEEKPDFIPQPRPQQY